MRLPRLAIALLAAALLIPWHAPSDAGRREQCASAIREILVTEDTRLDKDALLNARRIIKASHVTLDGNGATLVGRPRSATAAGRPPTSPDA